MTAVALSQQSSQQPVTLRVDVRRVVVDVVIIDAKGKAVRGLTEKDFRITEDGKSEPLRSFEPHTETPLPVLPTPKLPANTFSNFTAAPSSGPVTVLLYDLLNTPLEAQPFAHAQLLQFLKQRKFSGQIAIFILSDKLHMLQGFTDEDDQLIAALNAQGNTRYRSQLLQQPGESTQNSEQLTRAEGNQNAATDDKDQSFQAVSEQLRRAEDIQSSFYLDQRVRTTADAMEQIARFLVGLPGRKNLLWLSGSFPSGILPDGSFGGRDSFDTSRSYSDTLVRVSDLLNLAHVAVYPVDVRGVQVNSMFSAASNTTFEPGSGRDLKAVQNFSRQTAADHATMDSIAEETGGRAFYNTNGLKEAADTAVDEGSVYYTLTYSPPPPKDVAHPFDGNIRHVKVVLTDPALAADKLFYRRSYFNDDLDERVSKDEDAPTDPLAVTLQHGAPASHELFFEAHMQTYDAPVPATPEQLDVLAQYEARGTGKKPTPGKPAILDKHPTMMQRYVIVYGLLLRQLSLASMPDGTHQGDLEFAVISYNGDGLALNGITSKVADVIQPERYQHLADRGYQVVQTVAVPIEATSLRLAVRDNASRRLGSVEIKLPITRQPIATAPAETSPPAVGPATPASGTVPQ